MEPISVPAAAAPPRIEPASVITNDPRRLSANCPWVLSLNCATSSRRDHGIVFSYCTCCVFSFPSPLFVVPPSPPPTDPMYINTASVFVELYRTVNNPTTLCCMYSTLCVIHLCYLFLYAYPILYVYIYHLVESGILSDISVTPDQDHGQHAAEQLTGNRGSWSTLGGGASSSASANSTVILRRYKSYAHAAESAAPESK